MLNQTLHVYKILGGSHEWTLKFEMHCCGTSEFSFSLCLSLCLSLSLSLSLSHTHTHTHTHTPLPISTGHKPSHRALNDPLTMPANASIQLSSSCWQVARMTRVWEVLLRWGGTLHSFQPSLTPSKSMRLPEVYPVDRASLKTACFGKTEVSYPMGTCR